MRRLLRWVREWLGLLKPYVEIKGDWDDGNGISLVAHVPDPKAVRRRKFIMATLRNGWTITIVGGLIVAAVAKALGWL